MAFRCSGNGFLVTVLTIPPGLVLANRAEAGPLITSILSTWGSRSCAHPLVDILMLLALKPRNTKSLLL